MFKIEVIDGETWQREHALKAYWYTFGFKGECNDPPPSFTLTIARNDIILGWMECVVRDVGTVTWRRGGALCDVQGSFILFAAGKALLDYCHEQYFGVNTYIYEELNPKAARFARELGFIETARVKENQLIGVKYYCGASVESCILPEFETLMA